MLGERRAQGHRGAALRQLIEGIGANLRGGRRLALEWLTSTASTSSRTRD